MSGPKGLVLAAVLLFAASAAVALAARPPMPVDETRVLTVAWEMWSRGDYLVPHLNGAPYSDKPPLLYWAINGVWALFGVRETVARLVPPLFALAGIGLATVLAGLLWPERAAARGYAALVLSGTLAYALLGSLILFDAALAASVLLGLVGVALAWRLDDARGFLLFGAGLGLGILAKGPVAFVHLLPVPLLAPLWQRERRVSSWPTWYAGLGAGILLGAGIALVWALPAAAAGGEAYRRAILWGQTAGRIVHAFAHERPAWFYLAVLPALLFPWWLWPPLWRAARREARQSPDDGLRLVCLWIAAVLVVMSLVSGKQFHYLLPLLPAFALAAGRLLEEAPARAESVDLLLPALVPIALGTALLVVPGSTAHAGGSAGAPVLPAWVAALDPAAGAVLVVGTVAIVLATRWSVARAAVGVAACTLLLFAVAHGEWSRVARERYDLAPVAELLAARDGAGLAIVGGYTGEFGFLGRLRAPVAALAPEEVGPWLAAHPAGRLVVRYRDLSVRPPAPLLLDRPYRGGRLLVFGAP